MARGAQMERIWERVIAGGLPAVDPEPAAVEMERVGGSGLGMGRGGREGGGRRRTRGVHRGYNAIPDLASFWSCFSFFMMSARLIGLR